jgi:O-antigen/teichoic acid export membrane protein
VISLTQGLKNFADLFVVGTMLGAASAAVYSIALQVVLVISFGQMIISILLSRRISWSLKHTNIEQLSFWFRRSTYLSALLGVCYAFLVFFLGENIIISFLGNEYGQAFELAIILGLGRLFHLSVGPVMQVMALSNNQASASKISLQIGLINTVLSVALVFYLGMVGAAFAGAISIALWGYLLKRKLAELYPTLRVW